MLNRLSQQIRSLFSRPTRRRRANFGSSERLEPREMLTTVVDLVEDLNKQPAGFENIPGEIVQANGLHFFTTHTLEHGIELWRTDGTPYGTIRLTDLNNDPESRFSIRSLTAFQDKLYFIAEDYSYRVQIWVSDGTVGGTHVAVDSGSSSPIQYIGWQLTASSEAIYFIGSAPGSTSQVFRLDDATGATVAVTNFSPPEFFGIGNVIASGDQVYFVRYNGSLGPEIWKAGDDLEAPKLITRLSQVSNMSDVVAIGNNLYFSELTADRHRLWTIDERGQLAEITSFPGNGHINLSEGLEWNGELLLPYSISNGTSYVAGLWATDGTNEGSRIVSDSVYPSQLVKLGNAVFFLSNGKLWKSDGTISGTSAIGIDESFSQLVSKSGHLFLTSVVGTLWTSNGTHEGTHSIESPTLGAWLPFNSSSQADDGLLFFGYEGVHGVELWITDGDYSSAQLLKDLHHGTRSADASRLVNLDDRLFLTTNSGVSYKISHGQPVEEIRPNGAWYTHHLSAAKSTVYFVGQGQNATVYRADASGVQTVKTMVGSFVDALATSQNEAFFVIFGGSNAGLWHTDGSEAGTQILKSFPGNYLSNLTVDDQTGRLWFEADDGVHGSELWTSDGTIDGTHLVKDISEGKSSSLIEAIYAHDEHVYFRLNNQAWVSDGTEAGTIRLASVESSFGIVTTHSFSAVGDVIYMSVFAQDKGWAIIRTQRTPETSWFVTDLSSIGVAPFNLTAFKGQLAFAAWDEDGLGIWTSDDANSTRLYSFGPDVSIESWSIAEDMLLFTVNNRVTSKQEIWASDGTVEGTRKLRQEAFDVLYVPREATFVEYGGGIAFAAGTNEYGVELVRIDTTMALEAPTNVSVRPRTSSPSNSIHVDWDEMPGANDYEIHVLNETTQSIVVQQLLGSNQFDSNTLPAGAYRVLVRGRSITGDLSEWAQSASFAVGNPVINSVATSASATRTFQWVAPLGTLSSDVWLTNRDAGTRVLYQTGVTGNSLATPSALTPARYAVWVRSRLPGGQVTDWSAAVEFDVLAPAPTLISGSGTSNDGLPVISWTAVPGAASYQVQIHPVGSNTPLLSVSGLTATTFRVQQPMAGGRYLISIRAMKGTRQFAVPLLNQPLFVRRAPVGLKTEVRGFSWSPSPGALTYGYEIRNVRTNVVVMQGSQTSTIVQRSTAFAPGQYQARVFATYPAA